MTKKDANPFDRTAAVQDPVVDPPGLLSNAAEERTVRLRKLAPAATRPATASSMAPTLHDGSFPETGFGVLGDYELLAEVGQGGMGVVYRARHRSLNRIVALKVTRASPTLSHQETRQRLQVEAEVAARLDHPSIVPIYEMGEHNGQHFFSMAFVEGDSLARMVATGPLPPSRAARLIRTVAEAVAYAHTQGVIHRDLKPDNILVDGAGLPRITDFGLAKNVDSDTHLTRAGEVLGTPSYMPPEQVQGLDQVGPAADVYALGATLYCLLTGRPPFQAATALDTVKQVVERDPVPPRQLNPAVDRDLDTICLKCLEKRRERRYASAADLAADLGRFLQHRPIQARRVGPLGKAWRWCRRNPVVAGSLVSVGVMFLAAFALVAWSYWRAEDARQDAVRKGVLERWERYRSNVAAAAGALQLNNLSSAKRFLEAAPTEHHGWEWRHLFSQLDGAQTVIEVGVAHNHTPNFTVNPSRPELVLGTAEGELQWRDFASGKVTASARKHAAEITELQFSPDGQGLATGSKDGAVRLWKAGAAEPTLLSGFQESVRHLRYTADGKRLVGTTAHEGPRIWDVATGKQLTSLDLHYDGHFAIAPDASRFYYTTGSRFHSVSGLDPASKPVVCEGHKTNLYHFTLDPDCTRVATASTHPENEVRIWDLATGKQLSVLTGHKNSVHWVAFSPDGTRLVSASMDQTLRVWNANTGALVAILAGHTGPVRKVCFSPDGGRMASASHDGTARLWDAKTGALLGVLRGHGSAIYEIDFSADGDWLVTRSVDLTLRIWNTRRWDAVSFRGHDDHVYDVAFSPDGKRVTSVGWDGKLALWDGLTGQSLLSVKHDFSIVASVAFSAAGTRLVTLSRHYDNAKGRELTVWDAATGARICLTHLPVSSYKDSRAVFHPHQNLIAVGDADGAIFLVDAANGTKLATLVGHKNAVLDVAFRPCGTQLASCGADQTVRIWDVAQQKEIAVLRGHKADVFRVLYNPGGKLLASASGDHTVRLWDADTHLLVAELPHGCTVYGLAFSPDGTRLATGCADNTIRLWDLKTFQEVTELRGHEAYVHALAFSPDGTQLVSCSGDHMIRIWDTLSPRERELLKK